MTSARLRLFSLIAMVLLLIPVSIEPSYALPSFGSQVDLSCQAFNGTTPFHDQSCALCHSSNSPSTRDLNQNAQSFKNGNITAICPVTATAPVADAGPNQTVTAGTIVTLDGSKSTDSGGHALTFQWTLKTAPAGSAATLSSPTSVKPTFLADKAGQYVAQLVVNNGTLSSQPATVTITTNPLNTPPVANAGPNQTVQAGATVTLDGSGSSDTDGNPLTFQWSLKSIPAGSAAVLSNVKIVKPTFVADRAGDYVVQLLVNDGTVNSTPATVTITTNPANTPPMANAGPDQSVAVGATVTLNGSGSTDTSGNTLTYDWSFTSVPAGSRTELANPTSVMPTFVADLAGLYVIQLTVNNGTASTMDTITINAGSGNTLPVADAGPDQTVSMGTTVHLDGSKSKDVGGHALTYQWSLTNKPQGSNASLSNATTIMPSFAADMVGSYVAQLIVNNGQQTSVPDTVMVSVGPGGNSAPVADAGHNQVVSVGATVTLDGSASHDADNQPLTYHWSLITKPVNSQATLSDPMNVRPTFVVDVAGEYVAQLIVNDGKQDSRPATVMVRTFTVPTKRGIHISRARWQSDTGILSVSGRGPKNAVVDIIDAVSGAPIGTVTASDTGRFRFQATVTTSPCAVEVKSGQLVSHKALVRGTGDLCKTQFPPKQPRAERGTTTRSSQNLERERGQ